MSKIQPTALQEEKIKEHILRCYPEEACGILTEDDYVPCINIHENPTKAFRFDKLEYATNAVAAKAIIHSHTRKLRSLVVFDPRTPSYADTVGQKLSALPWLIYDTEGLTVGIPLQYPRIRSNIYEGRPFLWFISDCYTLVQDWYFYELGVALPDYKLEKDYTEIKHLNDLFTPYIEEYGFVEVPLNKIQRGDLLLLDNAGFHQNHLGIYDGKNVLHQDMLSVIVPFETFYGRINKVLRYAN